MTDQYSKSELELAVRQEKMALVNEYRLLSQRLTKINERLDELNKAEDLLEGM